VARARETAEVLAGPRPVILDERLVEVSWGAWEGQRTEDLLADPASGFRPTHEWGPDTKAPGGESAREAIARARPALAAIAAHGTPALIVTHKGLMRRIMALAGAAEPPEIKRGRLYPVDLAPDGTPRRLHPAIRLIARGG